MVWEACRLQAPAPVTLSSTEKLQHGPAVASGQSASLCSPEKWAAQPGTGASRVAPLLGPSRPFLGQETFVEFAFGLQRAKQKHMI